MTTYRLLVNCYVEGMEDGVVLRGDFCEVKDKNTVVNARVLTENKMFSQIGLRRSFMAMVLLWSFEIRHIVSHVPDHIVKGVPNVKMDFHTREACIVKKHH